MEFKESASEVSSDDTRQLTRPLLDPAIKNNLQLSTEQEQFLKHFIWKHHGPQDLTRRFFVGFARGSTMITLFLLDLEAFTIINEIANKWGVAIICGGLVLGTIESGLSLVPVINRHALPIINSFSQYYENFLFKAYVALRFFCTYPTASTCIKNNKSYLAGVIAMLPLLAYPMHTSFCIPPKSA